MIQTIQSKDVSLGEVKRQFNLQLTTEPEFFTELQADLPVTSAVEQQQLGRIQQNYLNITDCKSFSEEAVKMVVLAPLLDLASFYKAPFGLRTEEPIELSAEDEGLKVKGKIDVLVLKDKLWVLVIESKSTRFDVFSALPQALTYLLSAPNKEEPAYGLLVNGREFVFVKLQHKPTPIYARSAALSVEHENQLKQVLGILKNMRHKMTA